MKPRIITSYDNADWEKEWLKLDHYGLSGYDACRCYCFLCWLLLLARFFFAPLIRNIWSMFIMSIVILCSVFLFSLIPEKPEQREVPNREKKTLLLSFIVVVCLIWVFFLPAKTVVKWSKKKNQRQWWFRYGSNRFSINEYNHLLSFSICIEPKACKYSEHVFRPRARAHSLVSSVAAHFLNGSIECSAHGVNRWYLCVNYNV